MKKRKEKKRNLTGPSTGQDSRDRQNAGKGGSSLGHARTHGTHSTSMMDPFWVKRGRKEEKEGGKFVFSFSRFFLFKARKEWEKNPLQAPVLLFLRPSLHQAQRFREKIEEGSRRIKSLTTFSLLLLPP